MGWGAGGSCTPRPPIHQQTPQDTRVITVVFLGLLLDLLAFTLLLPLLPGLLESHSRAHVRPPPGPEASGLPGWLPTAPKPYHTSMFPRTPSMARGSEVWTGLPQPSGCQQRRGTTASCLEVRPPAPCGAPVILPGLPSLSPPSCSWVLSAPYPSAVSTHCQGAPAAWGVQDPPQAIRLLGTDCRGDQNVYFLQV